MTRKKIDALWFEAMHQSISAGEDFIRYHFAALVAAAEREACAQICDTESANESSFWEKGGWAHACGNCAALIRARGIGEN